MPEFSVNADASMRFKVLSEVLIENTYFSDDTNRILGTEPEEMIRIRIRFEGSNNILYIEEGVRLKNTDIIFNGDNALLYLSRSKLRYCANIVMDSDSSCVFGHNIFFHDTSLALRMQIHCAEGDNVVFANDSIVAFGAKIDTSYGTDEKKNNDVLIGQHVWLCQNSVIGGSTRIGGATVIGSNAQISNAEIPACSVWAGRLGQARQIHGNTVYSNKSIRKTAKHDLHIYDVISKRLLKSICDLAADDWHQVMDIVRTEDNPEARLEKLIAGAGSREYKRPNGNVPGAGPDDPAASRRKPDPGCISDNVKIDDKDNVIAGRFERGDKVRIEFNGSGNILFFEDGTVLDDARISFEGNNALVYVCRSDTPHSFFIAAHPDTTCYIGRGAEFSRKEKAVLSVSETENIIIGENCRIGSGVWIRTSDQHPIYDISTRKRINPPQPVIIGDDAVIEDKKLITKGSRKGVKKELFGNRYERCLRRLQKTTDINIRLKLLKKLEKRTR